MSDVLELIRPDDWHVHLRDGDALALTVPHVAKVFGRAIVMPNLVPPVVNVEMAAAYRQRIMAHVPEGAGFSPLMTLYLTDQTNAATIQAAHQDPNVYACKLYPAGATTNSAHGVTAIENILPAIAAMEELGLPLLLHGEVTDPGIDIFDREMRFLDEVLLPLQQQFPDLKIVLEHITTLEAVNYVQFASPNIAATITAHHLLFNRNVIFKGGINPHYYCLPVLKREKDREALIRAATSDCPKFFLGTDSAPHRSDKKESACGCAGIYTAHAALELYAQAFEEEGALDRLEAFASLRGPAFYGLEPNQETITLEKVEHRVPSHFDFDGGRLVPLGAGESFQWRVRE